jgi:hypothetical protein
MSTISRIWSYAQRIPAGHPVTSQTFMTFGERAAVDQALTRLVKTGKLARPARGVYVRPKHNPYVGKVMPEAITIAKAIAKETGSVVQVHGAEAARRMGFSTQTPMRPVFITDGPTRRFHLGAMEVLLQHVSPRKLALAERPAGMAFTALWYLGKDAVDMAAIDQVRVRLSPEEFQALVTATPLMPVWMQNAFRKYKDNTPNG